jgi:hypothetical protein
MLILGPVGFVAGSLGCSSGANLGLFLMLPPVRDIGCESGDDEDESEDAAFVGFVAIMT